MDNDAMTELYKSKMKLIYKYLRKNGCSRSDAEDIVQDAFYQALRYKETKVKTYLYRARNQFKKRWEEFGYER